MARTNDRYWRKAVIQFVGIAWAIYRPVGLRALRGSSLRP